MSDTSGVHPPRRSWCRLAVLVLALHSPLALALPAAAGDAASAAPAAATPSGIGPGLPLRRGDESAIGAPVAALTAVGMLVLAGWAAAALRGRRRGRIAPTGRGGPPWLARMLQPARRPRALRVVETAPLSPHARLHVVTWNDKEYLVSSSPGEVRILDTRAPGEAADAAHAAAGEQQ